MFSDPLVGLIGLSQYQKHSDAFISAAEGLRLHLSKYFSD